MASHSPAKRKRLPPAVSTIPPTPPGSSPPPEMRINTSIPGVTIEEDDGRAGSPRTKVAYNFQGLKLDEPGELLLPTRSKLDIRQRTGVPNKLAPRDELGYEDIVPEGEEEKVRKRVRGLKGPRSRSPRENVKVHETEIPETPQVPSRSKGKERKFAIVFGPERIIDRTISEKAKAVVLSNQTDPMIFTGGHDKAVARIKNGSELARSYPSINRLSDSKSRSKQRSGTPPLIANSKSVFDINVDGEERTIVDPERAALTWHDDEITGHNPDDPDDDGEGINGIGFRPTAAEAYARSQKRRQQMSEYKNREAREARKQRSERRRASEMRSHSRESREEQEKTRRVRFFEGGAKSAVSFS